MERPENLTDKNWAFVLEYVKDWNATQAAIRAGYSEDTAGSIGHELLKKPEIQQSIQDYVSVYAMDSNEVLFHLGEIARGLQGQYITERGGVDVEKIVKDNKAHLISSSADTRYGRKYIFHDRMKALELLGKTHAIFTDRIEQDGNLTINVKYEEE